MALSFGRKKGEATDEANNSPTSNGTQNTAPAAPSKPVKPASAGAADEGIDESWFDTLEEEATANPLPPTPVAPAVAPKPTPAPAAATPDFSAPPSAKEADFSVFSADDEPEDFGDFGTQVDIPAQPAATNKDVFVVPSSSASTPFDLPPVAAAPVPAPEKKGGLKKVLPLLLVLIVVGGGGAFWYSQQQPLEEDLSSLPAVVPNTAPPTGAQPTAAPAVTQADPQVKAQLKKLWDEGLALRKQNKNAAAKAKWGAAVRLARSKPGYEQSADMIQQAIDKLK